MSEDRALALEVLLAGERIGIAPNAAAVLRHELDRLCHHPGRRLAFVWKYWRHYSTPGFFLAVARILASLALVRLAEIGRSRRLRVLGRDDQLMEP